MFADVNEGVDQRGRWTLEEQVTVESMPLYGVNRRAVLEGRGESRVSAWILDKVGSDT